MYALSPAVVIFFSRKLGFKRVSVLHNVVQTNDYYLYDNGFSILNKL